MRLTRPLSPFRRLLKRPAPARTLPSKRTGRNRRTPRQAVIACGSGVVVFFAIYAATIFSFRTSTALGDPVFHRRAVGFEKRLHASATPPDLCIVTMGTSRVQNGLTGYVIEKRLQDELNLNTIAFNFACPGSGPISYQLQLKRLLERGIKPDHVIVEVFVAMLHQKNGKLIEQDFLTPSRIRPREVSFVCQYGIDEAAIYAARDEIESNPWQGLRYAIFDRIDLRLIPDGVSIKTSRAFDRTGGYPIHFDERLVEGRRRHADAMAYLYRGSLSSDASAAEACRAFEDFVRLCEQHGIALTLVAMPEMGEFRNWYSPANQLLAREMIQRLGRITPLQIVDAQSWIADEHFVDGHHLYRQGAEEFTRRLCDEHLIPAISAKMGSVAKQTK